MVAMDTIALVRICKGSNGLGGTPIPRTIQDSVIASDKSIGSTEKYYWDGAADNGYHYHYQYTNRALKKKYTNRTQMRKPGISDIGVCQSLC